MGEVIAFPGRRRGEDEALAAGAPARRSEPMPRAGEVPRPGRATARPETVLWRDVLGGELRGERRRQGRTLAEVAGTAGLSTQYLSEIERGLKDPSSEMLGAVAGALGLRLVDLTARVTRTLAARPSGPVALAA